MNPAEEAKGGRLTIEDFKKLHHLVEVFIREIEASIEYGLLPPEQVHSSVLKHY